MRSMSIFNSAGHEEAGPIDVALQPNEPIRSAISPALRNAALALSSLDGPKISPEISNRTKRRKSALVALRSVMLGADASCTRVVSTSLFESSVNGRCIRQVRNNDADLNRSNAKASRMQRKSGRTPLGAIGSNHASSP